jgi:hypothetical protein
VKASKRKNVWIEIHDVLHVPQMKDRLLSTNAIRNSGGKIVLEKGKGSINLGGVDIPLETCEDADLECIKVHLGEGKNKQGNERLYKVVEREVNELWDKVNKDEMDINYLHERAGHPEEEIMRNIASKMGVKLVGVKVHCAACAVSKSKRNSF